MKVKSLSRDQLLATPWTTAYQAPPSMGFSRQEYWSGVPLPYTSNVFNFKKTTYCIVPFYEMSIIGKSSKIESDLARTVDIRERWV